MNAPIKFNAPRLWPAPQNVRSTIKIKRGYRVIRRAADRPATTRPPIVIQLPAALHRFWAFLWGRWDDALLRQAKEQTLCEYRTGGVRL